MRCCWVLTVPFRTLPVTILPPLEDLKDPVLGLSPLEARHQTHTLVQSAFFPINKTWSSGAPVFLLQKQMYQLKCILLEKGANYIKAIKHTVCYVFCF